MKKHDPNGLFPEIESHPGNQILESLRAYRISVNIFSGNCLQLKQLIRLLEDPSDPARVLHWERRAHLQALFGEIVRHFHNFLTSVTTLVDHTRNLMKEDFVRRVHREEHQSRIVAIFANDPLAQFVQDCRNYVTHCAVPLIGLTSKLTEEPKPSELFIDLIQMGDWNGWSVASRKYIEMHKPQIRMLKVVDDYERKAKTFHEEFAMAFQRHYTKEIDEVLTLIKQAKEKLG